MNRVQKKARSSWHPGRSAARPSEGGSVWLLGMDFVSIPLPLPLETEGLQPRGRGGLAEDPRTVGRAN